MSKEQIFKIFNVRKINLLIEKFWVFAKQNWLKLIIIILLILILFKLNNLDINVFHHKDQSSLLPNLPKLPSLPKLPELPKLP